MRRLAHTAANPILAASPLADPGALPLRPEASVVALGATLVVAPHPDDESLGCGGVIALLRRYGRETRVLFVTDGSASHPGSRRYSGALLGALREREALAAVALLGVPADAVIFLRLPDGDMPTRGSPDFARALAAVRAVLAETAPRTLFLPWRRDPHPDHRASVGLLLAALQEAAAEPDRPRIVEYPVWLWHRGVPGDAPRADEVRAWRLDVRHALSRKRAAIAAHRSQTTDLIDDDPTAFRLTPELLAPFTRPWEVYLEGRQAGTRCEGDER